MLVGRVGQFTQGTARNGNPAPGQPFGEFRYWNIDAFAQDSWKLRSNLTLEYGVRFGYWTNNQELSGLGGYFTPDLYDPTKGSFLDPGTFQRVNGVCYVETGCAPDGVLDNRVAVRAAARQRRLGHRRRGQQRAPRRLRHVLQPQHGQRRIRQHAAAARRTPTRSAPTSGPAATTATASA